MSAQLTRWKAAACLALVFGIGSLYLGVQHVSADRVLIQSAGSIDELIPFWPHAIWVYQSMYLFMGIAVFMAPHRKALVSYVICNFVAAFIACVIFYCFPTAVPRPADPGSDIFYSLLISIDGIGNACPSLHMTFTLIACWFILKALQLERQTQQAQNRYLKIAFVCWSLSIMLSTLFTKQHIISDLIAGAVLAVFTLLLLKTLLRQNYYGQEHPEWQHY